MKAVDCFTCKDRGVVPGPGRKMRFVECPDCRTGFATGDRSGNKFSAEDVKIDGVRFASKAEARRYGELLLLAKAGSISGLKIQPKYPLRNDHITVKYPNGRVARYTADFEYVEDGITITEDVKSVATMTEAAKLRLAVFTAIYGREVRITE